MGLNNSNEVMSENIGNSTIISSTNKYGQSALNQKILIGEIADDETFPLVIYECPANKRAFINSITLSSRNADVVNPLDVFIYINGTSRKLVSLPSLANSSENISLSYIIPIVLKNGEKIIIDAVSSGNFVANSCLSLWEEDIFGR